MLDTGENRHLLCDRRDDFIKCLPVAFRPDSIRKQTASQPSPTRSHFSRSGQTPERIAAHVFRDSPVSRRFRQKSPPATPDRPLPSSEFSDDQATTTCRAASRKAVISSLGRPPVEIIFENDRRYRLRRLAPLGMLPTAAEASSAPSPALLHSGKQKLNFAAFPALQSAHATCAAASTTAVLRQLVPETISGDFAER